MGYKLKDLIVKQPEKELNRDIVRDFLTRFFDVNPTDYTPFEEKELLHNSFTIIQENELDNNLQSSDNYSSYTFSLDNYQIFHAEGIELAA